MDGLLLAVRVNAQLSSPCKGSLVEAWRCNLTRYCDNCKFAFFDSPCERSDLEITFVFFFLIISLSTLQLVAGFGVGGTSLPFWENVYGFSMSCVGKELVRDAANIPIVDIVDANDLVTSAAILHVSTTQTTFLFLVGMCCTLLLQLLMNAILLGSQNHECSIC